MDTLTQLLLQYRDAPKVVQIAQLLSDNAKTLSENNLPAKTRIQLSGLIGSSEAFVIAGTYLNEAQPYLIIAADRDEAAYMQNDLAVLNVATNVHFLTDSFKRPTYFEELNPNHVLQRTEIVSKMSHAGQKNAATPSATSNIGYDIIVTYPEALFEKVVAPKFLDQKRIDLKVGEKMDVDFMIEMLVEYGFDRVDFVYEPGQFSIRGGIVDVFSYGNELPYRIELFDIEVETIRTFNPTTQLSDSFTKFVSIVPNMNTRFERAQKVSMLQILPENTVVWVRDLQLLVDKLQICFERAEDFAQKISIDHDADVREIFRDRAFIRPFEIVEDIATFSTISFQKLTTQFGNRQLENQELKSASADTRHSLPDIKIIRFNSKPQPSFNKNFNLLIQNLYENDMNRLKNYLFTDNEKQIQRLFAIFRDLKSQSKVEPVMKALREGFIDLDLKLACYTDHQIFERFHRFRLRQGFSKEQALSLRILRELQTGDFVTHIDHGVGKFSGLEKININGQIQEAVRLVYRDNDLLYVSINSLHKIARFAGKDATPPTLSKIGSDAWNNLKRATKKKVKDIAAELIKLYALRKASPGFAFPEDNYLQNELEASFIYEDTPDQSKASAEVKADMEKTYPMDRLVCGDVGFGKTEIAIRAAYKAVAAGKQVAILVPTTLLALQHYKTFGDRLSEFGATVDFLNRFKSPKERKDVIERTKEGKVDILIGTHALVSKDVKFKDLGLLVIDEEQKFGVGTKEKLRHFKANVDTLTLTATPIPRTLQFSLMAARDLSIMRTPPPNRQPIHTEVRTFNEDFIKEAIYAEVNRGGQVFFVHNRVTTLPEMVANLRRLCPDVNMQAAHGQMPALEETLIDFVDKRFEVLVSTNIIETGLDISNANTMIINQAHHFGLSDLHQLRGRVGRSNKKAYCYLLCPPVNGLSTDARLRLRTIEEFADLGDGFNIAMRDMDIRGAGNLLGGEQSGFINDVGYETYGKILDEAVLELKRTDFKDLFANEIAASDKFVTDCTVDTDIEMHIPDAYVTNTQERLNLYTQLDEILNEDGIGQFAKMLRDRFGKIPPQVEELFDGLRLRWAAKAIGFERIVLKGNKLQGYFIGNPQSSFYETPLFKNILGYVLKDGKNKQMTFKQTPKHFIFIRENVRTLNGARKIVEFLKEL